LHGKQYTTESTKYPLLPLIRIGSSVCSGIVSGRTGDREVGVTGTR